MHKYKNNFEGLNKFIFGHAGETSGSEIVAQGAELQTESTTETVEASNSRLGELVDNCSSQLAQAETLYDVFKNTENINTSDQHSRDLADRIHRICSGTNAGGQEITFPGMRDPINIARTIHDSNQNSEQIQNSTDDLVEIDANLRTAIRSMNEYTTRQVEVQELQRAETEEINIPRVTNENDTSTPTNTERMLVINGQRATVNASSLNIRNESGNEVGSLQGGQEITLNGRKETMIINGRRRQMVEIKDSGGQFVALSYLNLQPVDIPAPQPAETVFDFTNEPELIIGDPNPPTVS